MNKEIRNKNKKQTSRNYDKEKEGRFTCKERER